MYNNNKLNSILLLSAYVASFNDNFIQRNEGLLGYFTLRLTGYLYYITKRTVNLHSQLIQYKVGLSNILLIKLTI